MSSKLYIKFTPPAQVVIPLILDEYIGAAYAYSFRKLRAAYTGYCCRVRRESDNAETDIGFTNNYVDESAILAFCGASFGYVVTWYDQSGNGVNKTQTTAVIQPVICFSGVVTKADGFVSMRSNVDTYSAKGLVNTISTASTSAMAFNVMKVGVGSECLPATNTSPVKFYGVMQPNASSPHTDAGSPTYYKNGTVFTTPTRNTLYTAFNGVFAVLTTYGMDVSTWSNSSSLYPSYRGIDGNNMEEIVYYTASANRAGIEANQMAYYGIS